MKTTIEIKENNINLADLYNIKSYTEDGIYLNTDENGAKMYVVAIKVDGFVLCLGSYSQFKSVFETNLKPNIIEPELNELEPLEEIEGIVSESFALKMVSIVLNKEKFNDVR